MAAALVLAVGAPGCFAGGEERFCEASLSIWTFGDLTVVPEDHGEPGRDDCDATVPMDDDFTLGLDCVLRRPGGATVAVIEPNRADGTCGQPDPGGEYPAINGVRPDNLTAPGTSTP